MEGNVARDRARTATVTTGRPSVPPARQTLGAVGRVASRVRTSGLMRVASLLPRKDEDEDRNGDERDVSPWGVGTAAGKKEGKQVEGFGSPMSVDEEKDKVGENDTEKIVEKIVERKTSNAIRPRFSFRPGLKDAEGWKRSSSDRYGTPRQTFGETESYVSSPVIVVGKLDESELWEENKEEHKEESEGEEKRSEKQEGKEKHEEKVEKKGKCMEKGFSRLLSRKTRRSEEVRRETGGGGKKEEAKGRRFLWGLLGAKGGQMSISKVLSPKKNINHGQVTQRVDADIASDDEEHVTEDKVRSLAVDDFISYQTRKTKKTKGRL